MPHSACRGLVKHPICKLEQNVIDANNSLLLASQTILCNHSFEQFEQFPCWARQKSHGTWKHLRMGASIFYVKDCLNWKPGVPGAEYKARPANKRHSELCQIWEGFHFLSLGSWCSSLASKIKKRKTTLISSARL